MEPVDDPTPEPHGPMDREPVLILLAALGGIVNGGLIAADAFDLVSTTPEQTAATVALVTLIAGVIATALRASVYCPATVARLATTGGADGRLDP